MRWAVCACLCLLSLSASAHAEWFFKSEPGVFEETKTYELYGYEGPGVSLLFACTSASDVRLVVTTPSYEQDKRSFNGGKALLKVGASQARTFNVTAYAVLGHRGYYETNADTESGVAVLKEMTLDNFSVSAGAISSDGLMIGNPISKDNAMVAVDAFSKACGIALK